MTDCAGFTPTAPLAIEEMDVNYKGFGAINCLVSAIQQRHISNMDEATETEELTRLHPDHVKVTRIVASLFMLVLIIPAIIAETAAYLNQESGPPNGVFIIPVLLIAAFFVLFMPWRRYIHRGFHMSADRIRIVRGYLFRSDTIVPFGRIQHIDVDQGPIQRRYDLATLTVHTAGNHNSTVSLPGLLHEDAIAMREEIRAHIKRDAI